MAYTGPAVNIANWIKNGATTATYASGAVSVPKAAVVAATGTAIKDTNYSDDIRDFLVATLDSVYKVYAEQTGTAKPTGFVISKAIVDGKIQYVVRISTNGDVDFPALS